MITRVVAFTAPSPGWIAEGDDGRPLGTATLWIPPAGGPAEVRLRVHPAERRSGVGTRLLREAAGADGVTALLGEPVREGSGEDAFCRAAGMRVVLSLTYTSLALVDFDQTAETVPGYRIVHWEGTVPDELAETAVRSRSAMDDMPMEGVDYRPEPWDVARLRRVAAVVADRGDVLLTTAAVGADGAIAGFTEVVLSGGEGQNYGTGVLPEHRGRGLARWLKVEQIRRVMERFPQVGSLLADTADSNVAMRRVNEALGYRPTHRSLLYQLDREG
ncbi:GNAT family N-acetyltransferase [Actinoplanes sp. G11-F43]|uniref:GNAT family N-acetyltransferase n=1 Tax=Actinoplanes sp. G11-F43 TaxID=3424130 RepID=UPI003D32B1F3